MTGIVLGYLSDTLGKIFFYFNLIILVFWVNEIENQILMRNIQFVWKRIISSVRVLLLTKSP